jgi:copper(I)-binding protein
MLQRLQRSLSVGDTVSIALLTANGDRITFIADVRAAGAAATADRKRMQ